jgi:hypothetical protein
MLEKDKATRPHTDSELRPGLFFSPGFYMAYWQECIEASFAPDVIWGHTKLQKHREMYAGAIMAAVQTKGTGIQHYVGLPDDEPSDVDVVKLEEITMPSGRKGSALQRLNIQLTECDFSRGETLAGQFAKKNKPAYSDIIIGIHAMNRTGTSDFAKDLATIKKLGKIYPNEVLVLEAVEVANDVKQPAGTFGLTRIYPKEGASLINLSDTEAFFFEPEVFTKTHKAVSINWEDKGSFTLLRPTL